MKDWRLYPAVQTLMSMRGVNRGVSGLGLDDERGAGIAVVVHEGVAVAHRESRTHPERPSLTLVTGDRPLMRVSFFDMASSFCSANALLSSRQKAHMC